MDAPPSPKNAVGGLRRAGERVICYWPLKLVGISAFFPLFFVSYFWILNHPQFPVTPVPRTFIDRMIPFQPGALPLYLSLWFYVVLPPALLRYLRELFSFLAASILLSVAGFAVFILWPTAVPRAVVDSQLLPELSRLKAVDATGNAFPSLHVAFAVFTAFWMGCILKEMGPGRVLRVLNWVWCIAIIYSTLAIRQHVALDAVSGALLGGFVFYLHRLFLTSKLATSGRSPRPST
jgi:membrane-associated phospholipid phosphatase